VKEKAMLFFAVVTTFMLLGAKSALAEVPDANRGNWIQGVLVKLEKMRDDAAARILANEETIRKTNDLIRQAQKLRKPEVEVVARRALAKTMEAKKKNEWQLKKAQEGIPRVRNILAKTIGQEAKIQAVVSHISGLAMCRKKDADDWIDLNSKSGVYLEPGDEIRTASGRVELRMLEGEGTLTVGPFTQFTMRKPGVGAELIDLYEGAIKALVQKLGNRCNKFKVRTPSVAIAVRGTQFLVNVDAENTTEIVVLDGTVEVSGLSGKKTVFVEAGQMIRAQKGGDLPEPLQVDLNVITRWWEAEQQGGSTN
jgi:ferric-dicitrate binding protein FerR (iron transport regulator)